MESHCCGQLGLKASEEPQSTSLSTVAGKGRFIGQLSPSRAELPLGSVQGSPHSWAECPHRFLESSEAGAGVGAGRHLMVPSNSSAEISGARGCGKRAQSVRYLPDVSWEPPCTVPPPCP